MKKKGITLVELVVAIALIAILAVTLAPRLRDQVAKAQDTKALAILGSLRTLSESYYAENQVKPFGSSVPLKVNEFDSVQEEDKIGLDLLIPDLSLEGLKQFESEGVWEAGDSYVVDIGGARESTDGAIKYRGSIGYTFHAPSGSSGDGIFLWFTQKTISPDGLEFDTKGRKWIKY